MRVWFLFSQIKVNVSLLPDKGECLVSLLPDLPDKGEGLSSLR